MTRHPSAPASVEAPGPGSTEASRTLGLVSASVTAALLLAYAVTLAVGLLALESPDEPIGDPAFTVLEVLILALLAPMVALVAAVHARAPTRARPLTLMAVVFMGLVAGTTGAVHMTILVVSRHEAVVGQPWAPLVLAFEWPSVVYALDVLAWDLFFPLAAGFAAPSLLRGGRWASAAGWALAVAAALAFAGLGGAALGDMQIRNVGVVGYVGAFGVACVLLVATFRADRVPPG